MTGVVSSTDFQVMQPYLKVELHNVMHQCRDMWLQWVCCFQCFFCVTAGLQIPGQSLRVLKQATSNCCHYAITSDLHSMLSSMSYKKLSSYCKELLCHVFIMFFAMFPLTPLFAWPHTQVFFCLINYQLSYCLPCCMLHQVTASLYMWCDCCHWLTLSQLHGCWFII